MHMKCLECNYNCGTPHTLLFQNKIEHKDKVSKCACGNQTISGNCVEEISSKLRGTASKCSSSNLRSSWVTKGEAPFTDSSSSSIFSSSSNPNSNSKPNSNSNSNSDSNSNSNSNSRSWGTKGEAPLACRGGSPFTDNHLRSSLACNEWSPFTDIETKFDNK